MKVVLTFAIAMLALTGCSALANDEASELKWFKTKEETIDHGIKEEKMKKEDIIGEVSENGETFVIYKKQLEEGLGVGVSSISEQDGKYAWYDPDQDVLVKNNKVKKYFSQINWGTTTQSGKSFTIYIGVSEDQSPIVKTSTSEVSPAIDKKTGIYFYIEPTK
ncbi:hypothetical protein [Metabacillus sediminilitoris]|uniref:Lipoprotein n=1 Tax=Metabacillus sediminilitoris TaxID=2567941 RepID=A0A4S4BRT3_9BACI|nr:hypothetical protein [Metabacillus sediminilitoris]QGQ45443.1 hypothetical protein GMB29_09370 [Metabacillus sediminilitoris]THF77700.1 hypothetical protein E6W99_18560 [Metabacillus sediminilitoris]